MPAISFLLTLMVIFAAITPGTCKTCTRLALGHCDKISRNNNDCTFYSKQIDCLTKLRPKCIEKLLAEVDETIKSSKRQKSYCPNLPDGTCYFNAIKVCLEDVPLSFVYQQVFTGQPHAIHLCKKYQSIRPQAETCLEDVRKNCTAKFIHKYVDGFKPKFDLITKRCNNALDKKQH